MAAPNRFGGKKAAVAGLLTATVAASMIKGVGANTEVAVFGPVLCRADEVGHLALRAARDVAKDWPFLRPSASPNLFSITPHVGGEAKESSSSSTGAWVVLDVSGGDSSSPYSQPSTSSADGETLKPVDLATPEFPLLSAVQSTRLSPRDRLLRSLPRRARWLFTRRFTLRLSWPANHPAGFAISVHTPQSMLRSGGISWSARPVDDEGRVELVSSSTQARSSEALHPSPPTANPGQATSIPSYRQLQAQLQDEDPPGIERWACPLLFAHVRAWPEAVPIPPVPVTNPEDSILDRLAELYVGPLWGVAERAGMQQPVPMHLTLEPVHALAVPANALPLLGLLLPTLLFVYFLARSSIQSSFRGTQAPA